MTKPVRFDREAEEELAAAVDWYESQQHALGLDLREVIDDAISRIGEAPLQFPLLSTIPSELGVRTCSVKRFPYSIVFLELPTEIRVLALAHTRRRPGYWHSRR